MNSSQIEDPAFRAAVQAIDAGDLPALADLLAAEPRLVRERVEGGEGYFHRPYLLWFVAENPVRNDTLPANIVAVTAAIVAAAREHAVESFQEQIDYGLGLVCSGRVVRERGAQGPLIDLLVEAGADPTSALTTALAHRESEAVARLLERGASVTLLVAACTGDVPAIARLGAAADAPERQLAFTGAALYGQAAALPALIDLGVEIDAFSPSGFHPHATALHHAVDSGVLDAVAVLVGLGARRDIRDRIYDGTPLDWALYLERTAIAAYLGGSGSAPDSTLTAES